MVEADVESRQRAVRDLEEAIRLDPSNEDHWLTLGKVYLVGEMNTKARGCFDRAVRIDPQNPQSYTERGRAWKRDWVRWLDTLSLARAIADFDTVTRLRPNGSEGWLALVPLLYDHGDLPGAARAAERALAGRPRVIDASLAVAYTSYRLGDVERADSLFSATIPRLSADRRRLFENAAPILGRPGHAGAVKRRPRPAAAQGSISGEPPPEVAPSVSDSEVAPIAQDVWDRLDPDPTTPENETRLEFWSRVAHAYFFFFDPLQPVLDSRADLYIRYGPPRSIDINPDGVATSVKSDVISQGRTASLAEYPMGVVRWNYPELGMRIVLNDRSLHGRFDPAFSRDFQVGSVPDPAVLSHRGDLQSLDGGRAIFPTLPPRALRVEVAGIAARFESGNSGRLLAQVQAIASPAETLASRWVVVDTTGRTVASGNARLAVSACDPATRQLAEVSKELPPGRYQLAVSVRGAGHRRGLFRAPVSIEPPEPGLGLSDVVISCGDPTRMPGGNSIRLDANVESIVSGPGPLVAYFEAYRLAAGSDGLAHFEVEYAVRRLSEAPAPGKRPKLEPVLLSSATRSDAQVAGLRRQFISVPVTTLTPGRYQLEIRVRDVTTQLQVERVVPFDRE